MRRYKWRSKEHTGSLMSGGLNAVYDPEPDASSSGSWLLLSFLLMNRESSASSIWSRFALIGSESVLDGAAR